jgi:hypothetical protein
MDPSLCRRRDRGVCEVGGFERWCYDAFVTWVDARGNLNVSTYLGGGLDDIGYALGQGSNGEILLAGKTRSSVEQGFPITSGALQPQKSLSSDGFLIQISEADGENPQQPYVVYLPKVIRK